MNSSVCSVRWRRGITSTVGMCTLHGHCISQSSVLRLVNQFERCSVRGGSSHKENITRILFSRISIWLEVFHPGNI